MKPPQDPPQRSPSTTTSTTPPSSSDASGTLYRIAEQLQQVGLNMQQRLVQQQQHQQLQQSPSEGPVTPPPPPPPHRSTVAPLTNMERRRPKPGILRLDMNKPRRSSGGSVEFRMQPQMLGEDITSPTGTQSPHQLTVTWATSCNFDDQQPAAAKHQHHPTQPPTNTFGRPLTSDFKPYDNWASTSTATGLVSPTDIDFSPPAGGVVSPTSGYGKRNLYYGGVSGIEDNGSEQQHNNNNTAGNAAIVDDEDEDYSISVSAIMQRRASVRGYRNKRNSRSSRRASSPMDHVLDNAERRRSSVYTTSSDEGTNQESTQEQIFENIRLHKEVIQSVKLQPWPMRKKLKLVRQAKTYVARHEGALQERFAMSRSTKDLWARFKILMAARWRHWKRETASFLTVLIPWELRIKEIESHFGSGVASYFTFLRWLMWVNIMIAIPLVAFVIGPEYFATKHDETDPRKKMSEQEFKVAGNLFTFWEFEGYLKYSPMFYGYYSSFSGASALGYKLPLAYFLTAVVVYIYSFVATLRKMAENSRNSKLSSKDDECTFSWKLFTGWDFMIGHAETAHNRIASVVVGFKEALLEEAEKKKDNRNWRIILQRILVNILVMGLLAASGYTVVALVNNAEKLARQDNWLSRNAVNVTMTLLSFFLPMIFEALGLFENWHPRQQLRLQLARIMILNMLNLYSLMFSFIYNINSKETPLQLLKEHNETATKELLELTGYIESMRASALALRDVATSTVLPLTTTTAMGFIDELNTSTSTLNDLTTSTMMGFTEDGFTTATTTGDSLITTTMAAASTLVTTTLGRMKCYNMTLRCNKKLSPALATTTLMLLNLTTTTMMPPTTLLATTEQTTYGSSTAPTTTTLAYTTNDPATVTTENFSNFWTTMPTTPTTMKTTTTTMQSPTTITTEAMSTTGQTSTPSLLTTRTSRKPPRKETTTPRMPKLTTQTPATTGTASTTTQTDASTTPAVSSTTNFFDYYDYFAGMAVDEVADDEGETAVGGERPKRQADASRYQEASEATSKPLLTVRPWFKSRYSRRHEEDAATTTSSQTTTTSYPGAGKSYSRPTSGYLRATPSDPRATATYPRATTTSSRATTTSPREATTYPRATTTYQTYPRATANYPTYPRATANYPTYPRATSSYSGTTTSYPRGTTTTDANQQTTTTDANQQTTTDRPFKWEPNTRLYDIFAYFTTSPSTPPPGAYTTTPPPSTTTTEEDPDLYSSASSTLTYIDDSDISTISGPAYFDADEFDESQYEWCVRQVCEPDLDGLGTTTEAGSTDTPQQATTKTAATPLQLKEERLKVVQQTLKDVQKNLTSMCWETSLGQELSKVIVFDGIMSIVAPLCIDFLRALFVRYVNQHWCWDMEKTFPQYGDFKIAENILTLINNQGQVWMGIFFSPGLVLINLVKLIIMMYFRSWIVLTCNVPHEVVFKASKSNNFYLSLLLTMLFLCVLPVGYAIVWLRPSWHCGPFSDYDRIAKFITTTTRNALPEQLHKPLNYLTSSSTVIPLLLLLILIIYYLVSLTGALREANQDLRTQLQKEREEERKKIFKVAETKPAEQNPTTLTSRWRKVLEASSPVTPTQAPDFETEEYKSQARKELISRIMKEALRKGSATSDDDSVVRRDDDDTDTEHHDSLPLDEENKEKRFGLSKLQQIRRTRKPSLVDIVQIAKSERERSQKREGGSGGGGGGGGGGGNASGGGSFHETAHSRRSFKLRDSIKKHVAAVTAGGGGGGGASSTPSAATTPQTPQDNDNDPEINSRIVNERRQSLLRRKKDDEAGSGVVVGPVSARPDKPQPHSGETQPETKPAGPEGDPVPASKYEMVDEKKAATTTTTPVVAASEPPPPVHHNHHLPHAVDGLKLKFKKIKSKTHMTPANEPEIFKFDQPAAHEEELATSPPPPPPPQPSAKDSYTVEHMVGDALTPNGGGDETTTPPHTPNSAKQLNSEKFASLSRQGRKKIGSLLALVREAVNTKRGEGGDPRPNGQISPALSTPSSTTTLSTSTPSHQMSPTEGLCSSPPQPLTPKTPPLSPSTAVTEVVEEPTKPSPASSESASQAKPGSGSVSQPKPVPVAVTPKRAVKLPPGGAKAPLETGEELDQPGPITFPMRSASQRRRCLASSNLGKPLARQDSQASVWSDNIPTITISSIGSVECIAETVNDHTQAVATAAKSTTTTTATGATGTPAGAAATPVGATVKPVEATVKTSGAAVKPVGAVVKPVGATVKPAGPTVKPAGSAVKVPPVAGVTAPSVGASVSHAPAAAAPSSPQVNIIKIHIEDEN